MGMDASVRVKKPSESGGAMLSDDEAARQWKEFFSGNTMPAWKNMSPDTWAYLFNAMGVIAQGKPKEGEIPEEERIAFLKYCRGLAPEAGRKRLDALANEILRCEARLGALEKTAGGIGTDALSRASQVAELTKIEKADIDELRAAAGPGTEVAELVANREEACVAALNAYGMKLSDYQITGIKAKNQLSAAFKACIKARAGKDYERAVALAQEGNMKALAAELSKLGEAGKFFFSAMLARAMIRNGMWNTDALGALSKGLELAEKYAAERGGQGSTAKARLVAALGKFLGRNGDWKGLNMGTLISRLIS
jgi:hypothetical protein